MTITNSGNYWFDSTAIRTHAFPHWKTLIYSTTTSGRMGGWLLEGYVRATPKVKSEWVLTCDSAHSLWLYSAAPPGNQAASTWYLTESDYPDTALPSLRLTFELAISHMEAMYSTYLATLWTYRILQQKILNNRHHIENNPPYPKQRKAATKIC